MFNINITPAVSILLTSLVTGLV